MKSIFVGIIGFSVIVALIKGILPEGKMNKVTCIALSFVFTLSLLGFFGGKKDFNVSADFINFDYDMQYEIMHKKNLIKYVGKRLLSENGIECSDLDSLLSEKGELQSICVSLSSDIIYTEQEHIDLTERIKDILSDYFIISADMVTVNE